MNTASLVRRNLTWFWRTNLAVVIGVATAVAVLAGALLVGDSVRQSLRQLALARLGRTDLVVSGRGFFRQRLIDDWRAQPVFAESFGGGCAMIALQGVVTRDENHARAGEVQVYGVDRSFWEFNGLADAGLEQSEALISPGLARELGAERGEMLALRIGLPSAIPIESLHGRKDDPGRTIRVTLRDVLPAASMGEFSLQPRQGEVRAIFLPLDKLQRNLEQEGRANLILLAARSATSRAVAERLLREQTTLADLGIRLREVGEPPVVSVETESAVISDPLAERLAAVAAALGLRSQPLLSYLANTIRIGGREIPYSLVTAVAPGQFSALSTPRAADGLPPLVLNRWAADDLAAKVGDVVTLEYYRWEEAGRLSTASTRFRLVGIEPLAGLAADPHLAPEYPGITGAESLSDWDPPFPLDLERVRKSDEEYWDRYRATPKAFLLIDDARPLWSTRYGGLTSIRLVTPQADVVADELRRRLDPLAFGLAVTPVRELGLGAARGATDFGEYFSYFSFFLVVSALLLVTLFFRLGIEQRMREIGLYRALGYPPGMVRSIFLREGLLLAILGSLLGIGGAIAYGALMMYGLRTWWVGAVGTTLLELHIAPLSLLIGLVAGITTATLCIWWTVRSSGELSPRSQLAGSAPEPRGRTARWRNRLAVTLLIAGLLLMILAMRELVDPVGGFFGAGSLLLIAALLFWGAWLRRGEHRVIARGPLALARIGFRNATTRPGRSVLSIALIASAAFIIVSVEAFRRGDQPLDPGPKSGTGGFALVAESLLPLVHNPDLPEGREELGLPAQLGNLRITRFRLHPGDDTSCLNLYQPANPRIIGVPASFVNSGITTGRFNFQAAIEAVANPWELLGREGETIPIIVDANSMTYVLHRKLGESFEIPNGAGEPVRVRIVATLADSLLQSELLMSESNFLRLYPDEEGYRWFGIDIPIEAGSGGGAEQIAAIAALLEERLVDYGFDATGAAAKLASFHAVENTYLSTFQTLGGLGLLLGTIGLGAVLLRNVLERRRELALLTAVGYRARHLAVIVLAENIFLLGSGLLTGGLAALLAIAPTLIERGGRFTLTSLALLLLAVLVTGLAASLLAVRAAVRAPVLAALRSES